MLPLTTDNLTRVFKTGVLTVTEAGDSSGRTFGLWLDIPSEYHANPHSAADWWMRNGKNKRWSTIIYHLDMVGEIRLADELMPYCEPPSGA